MRVKGCGTAQRVHSFCSDVRFVFDLDAREVIRDRLAMSVGGMLALMRVDLRGALAVRCIAASMAASTSASLNSIAWSGFCSAASVACVERP